MADSDLFGVVSSADQMRKNYEQFKDKFVDKDKDLISQETFLKLLIAEMSNQDPLEPTSNTEFISQLAQFSSMQYMQDSSKYAMANYASSLVGKTVSASKMDGVDLVIKTGVVEKAVYKNNTYVLTIDGEEFDISKVTSIVDGSGSASGTQSPDSLADRIAKASQMVGMYAFVKTGKIAADGSDELVHGFIESIMVKDGNIKIVVAGEIYDIEAIDELTYATIVDDPENPDDVEGTDPADPADPGNTTDPTDPSESDDSVNPSDPSASDKTTDPSGASDPNNSNGQTISANGINDIYDVSRVLNDILNGPHPARGSAEEQKIIDQIRDIINSMI